MKTHIAIMRKSWGLTEKILTGEKVIESRWYKNKYQPWNSIEIGDVVYFENSGESVTIKTKVKNVSRFSDLTPKKVRKILKKYGKADGLDLKNDFTKYFEMFKNKKYCLLVFLKEIQKIEPFKINKKGFGNMSSWLVVRDINQIRIN